MIEIFIKIIPTFLFILLGYFLKRRHILNEEFGKSLLKFVFIVPAPALALRGISALHLDMTLFPFFILAPILTVISYLLVKPLETKVHLAGKQFAVFLMATMIVNSGFTLPFVIALFGDEGAARVAFFNVMNNIIVFGWVYYIAISYGQKNKLDKLSIIKKVVFSPAFFSIVLALLLNVTSIALPHFILAVINPLADLTNPLILIALGLIMELKIMHPKQTVQSLLFRMLGGFIVGVFFVKVFALSGINAVTTLLLSASPVGFNTVTFSSLEDLDDDFAASIVSMGLVAGIIILPVLSVFLSYLYLR